MAATPDAPDLRPLLDLGSAFSASRVLLTAIELDLFTVLSRGPLTASEIATALKLHQRAVPDFPDALLSLNMLTREGDGPEARYSNGPLPAYYLVKGTPTYKGGFFEMCATRLYHYWGHFTEALQTGRCQNESHPRNADAKDVWSSIYETDEKLEGFMQAMGALNNDAQRELAKKMDWATVSSHLDLGGADGLLSCEVVSANPHVKSTTLDLERVSKVARNNIAKRGLTDKINIVSGSFWDCPFPKADVITMGIILHDYNLEKKMVLLRKAYDALNPGGRLVALEHLIEDDRRGSVPALIMSLNMLVDQNGGFDFTSRDFDGWAKEVGFDHSEKIELIPPLSAVIAYKKGS